MGGARGGRDCVEKIKSFKILCLRATTQERSSGAERDRKS